MYSAAMLVEKCERKITISIPHLNYQKPRLIFYLAAPNKETAAFSCLTA